MSVLRSETRQSKQRRQCQSSTRSDVGRRRVATEPEARSASGHPSSTGKSGAARAPNALAAHPFRPGLAAAQVDRELRAAVRSWQSAEHCVVLWFAEFNQRRLYKKLGYGSIHLYATEVLGFSQARSYQFLQLAERLRKLSLLEKAVACGELGWTKAQIVASVATPQTEQHWLQRAKALSRRELQDEIGAVRRQTRSTLSASSAQMQLGSKKKASVAARMVGNCQTKAAGNSARPDSWGGEGDRRDVGSGHDEDSRRNGGSRHDEGNSRNEGGARAAALADRGRAGADHKSELDFGSSEVVEMPLSVGLSFTPEQFARYEALVAKLRQRGHRAKKAELILSALENLLSNSELTTTGDDGGGNRARGATGRAKSTGCPNSELTTTRGTRDERHRHPIAGPAYQIHIQHCLRCEAATVSTSRGDRPIDRATLQSALCDAKLHRGEHSGGRSDKKSMKRARGPSGKSRTVSTTPPRLRREVLERDHFRCRMPGCRNRQFLQVHHIVAKEDGGKHRAGNLITLCGACHRALHALGAAQQRKALQRASHQLE